MEPLFAVLRHVPKNRIAAMRHIGASCIIPNAAQEGKSVLHLFSESFKYNRLSPTCNFRFTARACVLSFFRKVYTKIVFPFVRVDGNTSSAWLEASSCEIIYCTRSILPCCIGTIFFHAYNTRQKSVNFLLRIRKQSSNLSAAWRNPFPNFCTSIQL